MKELIDLLTRRDRIFLGGLCLALAVVLVFDVFFAGARKKAYFSASHSLSSARASLQTFEEGLKKRKAEEGKWLQTQKDLEDVKVHYLYSEEGILTQARLDLEKIFRKTGIPSPALEYEYEQAKNETIQTLYISFVISESYFKLRQFIHAVETFPKFIILEKVDFLDVDAGSGTLRLRITLAEYYEK